MHAPRLSSSMLIIAVLLGLFITLGFAAPSESDTLTKRSNCCVSTACRRRLPDLYEATIAELSAGLEAGDFTSVDLVKAYFARIEEVNLKGPALRTVIELNPKALAQAAVLDRERKMRGSRGPLHGIPILLKDNIATLHSEGMNTTAGSFALLGSVVPRDAGVAARLRRAGVIFLGKTNMSEWANFRGIVPSGFSARGGQTTNAYFPNVDPSGSSSGSGVAMSIGLGAGSLGSETDGSIVSPSGRNNIVGIKPTVGLTSRAGVIPISSHQDTVGPMCRSVADAAVLLTAIAGKDPRDPATLSQPSRIPNYLKALDENSFKGRRLGVPRRFQGRDENQIIAFNASLNVMRRLGATIVDPAEFPNVEELLVSQNETIVLTVDFKVDLNAYFDGLRKTPPGVRSLADVIQYNIDNANLELIPPFYDDQSQMIASQNSTVNAAYHAALRANKDLGATRGIDATLKKFKLDAIILPTDGFTSTPPAIAGYPIVSVPLGFQPEHVAPSAANPIIDRAPGVPFGLSFIGTAYSEFSLISFAYAYEQATLTRLGRRAFKEAVPKTQLEDVICKD